MLSNYDFPFSNSFSHRPPLLQVAIFGDSIVISLKDNERLLNAENPTHVYDIFCYPEATYQSLRHLIPQLPYILDVIILHVGTNSSKQVKQD